MAFWLLVFLAEADRIPLVPSTVFKQNEESLGSVLLVGCLFSPPSSPKAKGDGWGEGGSGVHRKYGVGNVRLAVLSPTRRNELLRKTIFYQSKAILA